MTGAEKIVKERGAPLMDKIKPGWEYLIELHNLISPHQILEMTYGSFDEGAAVAVKETGYSVLDYGLDEGAAPTEDLLEAWREEVHARRGVTKSLF